MNRNCRLLLVVTAVVVLLLAASVLTWRSAAAPALQEPVPGGPGFVMLNPYAFRAWSPTSQWAYHNSWQLYNPSGESQFYMMSLSLPDNVTITKMVVYFYDNSAADLTVWLYREHPATGDDVLMAYATSTGAQAEYRNESDSEINAPAIDQQSYSYTCEVSLPGGVGTDLRLTGVRIDYAYSAKMPLVVNDH
jgi:hypothetical protein